MKKEKKKNIDNDENDDDDAAVSFIPSFVRSFLPRSSLKSRARLVDNVFMRIVEAVGWKYPNSHQ
jgi:hypothetical protein